MTPSRALDSTFQKKTPETVMEAKELLNALFDDDVWNKQKDRIDIYQLAVTTLLKYPQLASHHFGTRVDLYPFTLLFMSRCHVNFEVIQSIYNIYRSAALEGTSDHIFTQYCDGLEMLLNIAFENNSPVSLLERIVEE